MYNTEAILDFGSSKVVCVIGALDDDHKFDILGIESKPHKGLRRGAFLDESQLRRAVFEAFESAQSMARRRIRTVAVAVPSSVTYVVCRRQEVVFDTSINITEKEIISLINKSIESVSDESGTLIHTNVARYKLDGSGFIYEPIGQIAQVVEAAVSHVFLMDEFKSTVLDIMREIGVSVSVFVDSIYAEGFMIAGKMKKSKIAIADVGYYETDIAIVMNQVKIFGSTIQVGGAHFASDLTYVLHMPKEDAESVKKRYVFGLDYTNRVDTYKLKNGEIENFDYETIQQIIESRADELCSMIYDNLCNANIEIEENMPVFLTGGGLATMRGAREFMQSRLNLLVSTDSTDFPRLNTLNYVSTYAVLYYLCITSGKQVQKSWKERPFLKAVFDYFF